jgi:flagellar biosynthesis protein FlhB
LMNSQVDPQIKQSISQTRRAFISGAIWGAADFREATRIVTNPCSFMKIRGLTFL